jgi:hypothetical protein
MQVGSHREGNVHESILHSNWDTLLIGIPFLFMLLVGVFRLDELMAAPKHRPRQARPASGVDREGNVILSDPDGKLWHSPRPRR